MLYKRFRGQLFYAAIGLVNTMTDIFIFIVLTKVFSIPPFAANICSFSIGSVQSYLLNSRHTFGGERDAGSFFRFSVVTFVCLFLSTIVVHVLAPMTSPIFAKLCATASVFLLGYYANRLLTFTVKNG